jgi:hypothetical protein
MIHCGSKLIRFLALVARSHLVSSLSIQILINANEQNKIGNRLEGMVRRKTNNMLTGLIPKPEQIVSFDS